MTPVFDNIAVGGRIGILFSRDDLKKFAADNVDLLLMLPGASFTEQDAAREVRCPVHNLNRYCCPGGLLASSRQVAPVIRLFFDLLENCPLPARVSPNELYQYNLRMEFYFLHALTEALRRHKPAVVVARTPPYHRYISAERPDHGTLYQYAPLYSLLAQRVCARMSVAFEAPAFSALDILKSAFKARVRATSLAAFHIMQNARKTLRAREDRSSRAKLAETSDGNPIGIVVRTDAEVVAALPLCADFRKQGVDFVLIHDEMISSQTTLPRIIQEKLPYVSVGGALGLEGLFFSFFKAPRRLQQRENWIAEIDLRVSPAAEVFLDSPDIWAEMRKRALDFAFDQTHFAMELDAIVQRLNIRGLVTFGFLDQWGPAAQECGDRNRIPSICLQCTAQDLWEYPQLGWARHYCCQSVWLRNELVALGRNPHGLVGTGLPHLMSNLAEESPSAQELLARRKFVVCTQPAYYEHLEALIQASANVAAEQGFDLVIKYHPRQVGNEYDKLVARLSDRVKIECVSDRSIDEVLRDATIMLSIVSTTITRAIFLGVPAFSLWPVEEQHIDVYYVTHPVTQTADTGADIETALRACLANFAEFHVAYASHRRELLATHAVFEPTSVIHSNVTSTVLSVLG